MRDIMMSGYVAGGNTRFFGEKNKPAAEDEGHKPYAVGDIQNAIDERLSLNNDSVAEYDSMLAFGAPYGDGAKRDQVISLTDRLLPWEVTKANSPDKEYFPGGNTGFTAYRGAFRLNTIHFGEDVRAAENMDCEAPPVPEARKATFSAN
jgi:hypothetical protein